MYGNCYSTELFRSILTLYSNYVIICLHHFLYVHHKNLFNCFFSQSSRCSCYYFFRTFFLTSFLQNFIQKPLFQTIWNNWKLLFCFLPFVAVLHQKVKIIKNKNSVKFTHTKVGSRTFGNINSLILATLEQHMAECMKFSCL